MGDGEGVARLVLSVDVPGCLRESPKSFSVVQAVVVILR